MSSNQDQTTGWASYHAHHIDSCPDNEDDVRSPIIHITLIREYINSMANEDFITWIMMILILIVIIYILYYVIKYLLKSENNNLYNKVQTPLY